MNPESENVTSLSLQRAAAPLVSGFLKLFDGSWLAMAVLKFTETFRECI